MSQWCVIRILHIPQCMIWQKIIQIWLVFAILLRNTRVNCDHLEKMAAILILGGLCFYKKTKTQGVRMLLSSKLTTATVICSATCMAPCLPVCVLVVPCKPIWMIFSIYLLQYHMFDTGIDPSGAEKCPWITRSVSRMFMVQLGWWTCAPFTHMV